MFKIGSPYSRKDVGWVVLPKQGRPKGGNWDTGYVPVGDKLIVFMNMGVPGKTGHNYSNSYDDEKKEITWYGKTKSHSGQDFFKKICSGELTPYYFARWDTKDPNFVYLGIGEILNYTDNIPCLDGKGNPSTTMEIKLRTRNSGEIFKEIIPAEVQPIYKIKSINPKKRSKYEKEKNLEKFLIRNWGEDETSIISDGWDLVPNPATGTPGQNWVGSGPLDILAINKDKSVLRVIELKKGQASDFVVGQITRYMGWIKNNLLSKNQSVEGLIIAYEDDPNIKLALEIVNNIKFLKYRKFQLLENYNEQG